MARTLGVYIARVEATLLLGCLFPPPATFAFVLAWRYRASTGLTANGDKPAFVEFVIGHFAQTNIIPHLLG